MSADINNDNSFLIRFRSSVILMVITITAIVLGGYVLLGVLFVVSLIGMMELCRALGVHKSILAIPGYLAVALWYAALFVCESGQGTGLIGVIAIALLIALLIIYVAAFPKFKSEQLMGVFFGFFYVAVLLSYISSIRNLPGGQYSVWLLFIGSWGADTMAYLVGRKWGRHKIVPVLSPKKSLEGFIGGICGAILIGVIYSLIFRTSLNEAGFSYPVAAFAITAGVSAVVSIFGDLAASAIKRDKGIKDYGRLIPGHGGILDRFDSVIIIAPIIYYLLVLIKH